MYTFLMFYALGLPSVPCCCLVAKNVAPIHPIESPTPFKQKVVQRIELLVMAFEYSNPYYYVTATLNLTWHMLLFKDTLNHLDTNHLEQNRQQVNLTLIAK